MQTKNWSMSQILHEVVVPISCSSTYPGAYLSTYQSKPYIYHINTNMYQGFFFPISWFWKFCNDLQIFNIFLIYTFFNSIFFHFLFCHNVKFYFKFWKTLVCTLTFYYYNWSLNKVWILYILFLKLFCFKIWISGTFFPLGFYDVCLVLF